MIIVAAGVIVRTGDVLACQRRADGHHPLKWEFPGGKAEPGESIIACLQRELREELGIDAKITREMWFTEHTYAGREPIGLHFLLVSAYRGVETNRAFAQIRWLRCSELAALDFLDGDREFIARLARGEISLTA